MSSKRIRRNSNHDNMIVKINAPIIITGKLMLIRRFFVAILNRFPLKLELYAPTPSPTAPKVDIIGSDNLYTISILRRRAKILYRILEQLRTKSMQLLVFVETIYLADKIDSKLSNRLLLPMQYLK